jgi:hypothetical protein
MSGSRLKWVYVFVAMSMAMVHPVEASTIEVHLLPVGDAGGSLVDTELTKKLHQSIDEHAPKTWNVIQESGLEVPQCNAPMCVIIDVKRSGNGFAIRIRSSTGEILAFKSVTLPSGIEYVEVADALFVKIVFMLKKVEAGQAVQGPANENKSSGPEEEPRAVVEPDVAQDEPIVEENPQMEEGEAPPPEVPAEAVDSEEPEEPQVQDVVPTLEPPPETKPDSKKNVELRLPIGASFLTGFNEMFNSGGLDVGFILVFYRVIGLRIDAGVQFGGHGVNGGSLRHVALPIDLMGGYRAHFGRVRFGISAGLYMLGLWLDFLTQERGEASDYVIGIGGLFDLDFEITPSISLGLYLRPAYVTDNVDITDDTTTIFRLPKLQFACGISILVNISPRPGT